MEHQKTLEKKRFWNCGKNIEHCQWPVKFIFYSKDEATNFHNDITNDYAFKSFEYKAKLLGKQLHILLIEL